MNLGRNLKRRESFEHLPFVPLIGEELAAFDYFDMEDNDITYDDGKTVRSKEPKYWLPHSKYILGNKHFYMLLFSFFLAVPCLLAGFGNLDLDVLGVDEDFRPLTHLPPAPSNDYETMHDVTNGRRGGNRNGP